MQVKASVCNCLAVLIILEASLALTGLHSISFAQFVYPGGGTQGFPGAYRVTAGYGSLPVRGFIPGSEPAAGQLRSFPGQIAPPVFVAVPGDNAGVYRTPYVPDVLYVGKRPWAAGYRELNNNGRPRLFRTPAGGTGLPLVTYGGFWDNRAPIEYTTPAADVFTGYYGTVVPITPSPPVMVEAAR